MQTISRLGGDVRVGIGPSITVPVTASAQIEAPGGVLAVAPGEVTDWLAPLPVDALHGIGPRQAEALHEYGIHTVGRARPPDWPRPARRGPRRRCPPRTRHPARRGAHQPHRLRTRRADDHAPVPGRQPHRRQRRSTPRLEGETGWEYALVGLTQDQVRLADQVDAVHRINAHPEEIAEVAENMVRTWWRPTGDFHQEREQAARTRHAIDAFRQRSP
ncbi:hypothetical protein ACIP10_34685 [Streptomyces galbus]|uniref:hypothetical protein n=1 Tax=Streptomyces galbus TaxID=33898 RepID=UPI00380B7A18